MSDKLVEPLSRDSAVPLLVNVGAMSIPRRAAVEENTETYRRSAR